MQIRELTVVYSIADEKKFDAEEMPRIKDLSMPGSHDDKPYRIHGMSCDDEMRRGGLIEEALDRLGETSEAAEVIREILSCPDLSKWSWPK